MKKQKVVFLKVDESTLVENFADFIDQNYPENSNMKEQKQIARSAEQTEQNSQELPTGGCTMS